MALIISVFFVTYMIIIAINGWKFQSLLWPMIIIEINGWTSFAKLLRIWRDVRICILFHPSSMDNGMEPIVFHAPILYNIVFNVHTFLSTIYRNITVHFWSCCKVQYCNLVVYAPILYSIVLNVQTFLSTTPQHYCTFLILVD